MVIRLLEQTEHSPGLLASKHDCQTTNSIPLWINEKSDCQPRDERFTKLHMQAYLQWHADCTDWFRCIVLLLSSSKTASTPHLNENHRLTAIYFMRIPITIMRGLRAEGLRSNGVMELHDPYKKSCPVKVDDKKDGRMLVAKGLPDCCQVNQLVNEGNTVVFDCHANSKTSYFQRQRVLHGT